MKAKCLNRGLFIWSDLKAGKVFCYKGITISGLMLLVVSIYIFSASETPVLSEHTGLLVWLGILAMAVLCLSCLNRNAKIQNSYLEVKNNKVYVFDKGKLAKTEQIENLQIQAGAWAHKEFGLRPALILKSSKLGTIRIGNAQYKYDWHHINTIIDDTHYVVERTSDWNNMVRQLRSSHIKKTYNPLTYSPLQTVLSLTNNWP